MSFQIVTEMPSGARSCGYSRRLNPQTKRYEPLEDDVATDWFGKVLDQMKSFGILGSAVLMFSGETEVMKESI